MSKFFNETQKAHQWAQQKLVNQDLDVRQMLESLKQAPAINAPPAQVSLAHRRQVTLGNGNAARLVLRQDDSLDAALEAYRGLLGHCGEMFKVILIDAPPILPLADFELISAACDGIVMVVRAHHGQRKALEKTARTLDTKKLLGVVFNATDFSVKDHEGSEYGN